MDRTVMDSVAISRLRCRSRLRLGDCGANALHDRIFAGVHRRGRVSPRLFPHFGTLENAANILSLFGPLAMLSVGQMIVVLIRGFDLSVGLGVRPCNRHCRASHERVGLVGLAAAPIIGLAFGLLNGVAGELLPRAAGHCDARHSVVARGMALIGGQQWPGCHDRRRQPDGAAGLQVAAVWGLPLSAVFAAAVFGLVAFVSLRDSVWTSPTDGRRRSLFGGVGRRSRPCRHYSRLWRCAGFARA